MVNQKRCGKGSVYNCIEIMAEHNNTEKAVLEAAEAVFMEKGYRKATTTAIASKAGVTHAMLHYYFRTKEQIFLKVVDRNVSEMMAELVSVMSPDLHVWEIVKGVVNKHFEFLGRHRRIPHLMLEMAEDFPEVMQAYKDRITGAVTEEMARHRQRFHMEALDGRMNEVEPAQLLFFVISSNISAYLSVTVLENVLKWPEEKVSIFLESRREETLKSLYARLYFKDIPENI